MHIIPRILPGSVKSFNVVSSDVLFRQSHSTTLPSSNPASRYTTLSGETYHLTHIHLPEARIRRYMHIDFLQLHSICKAQQLGSRKV